MLRVSNRINLIISGAQTLGFSIKDNSGFYSDDSDQIPDMILLYVKDTITPGEMCRLRAVGWTLQAVDVIEPFRTSDEMLANPLPGAANAFTNLLLWNMTQYDSLIYLAPNTLVVSSILGAFDLVMPSDGYPSIADLAVVSGVHKNGFNVPFDTGIIIMRPSESTFHDMISRKSQEGKFSNEHGVNGFLNDYFGMSRLVLPFSFALSNVMEDENSGHMKYYLGTHN